MAVIVLRRALRVIVLMAIVQGLIHPTNVLNAHHKLALPATGPATSQVFVHRRIVLLVGVRPARGRQVGDRRVIGLLSTFRPMDARFGTVTVGDGLGLSTNSTGGDRQAYQ